MQQAQYIACVNAAGFVMNFSIKFLDTNTGEWKVGPQNSGNYPIGQERSLNGADNGIPNGAPMTADVHAILGVSNDGKPLLAYAANGQTATYNVHGTTLIYSVDLVTAAQAAGAGQGGRTR